MFHHEERWKSFPYSRFSWYPRRFCPLELFGEETQGLGGNSESTAIDSAAETKRYEMPDWKLVWADEFDRDGLPDPKKWGYEKGLVRNAEKQFYTEGRAENAGVEDGNLLITALREPW